MKTSKKVIQTIIFSLILATLSFSLVACNGKTKNKKEIPTKPASSVMTAKQAVKFLNGDWETTQFVTVKKALPQKNPSDPLEYSEKKYKIYYQIDLSDDDIEALFKPIRYGVSSYAGLTFMKPFYFENDEKCYHFTNSYKYSTNPMWQDMNIGVCLDKPVFSFNSVTKTLSTKRVGYMRTTIETYGIGNDNYFKLQIIDNNKIKILRYFENDPITASNGTSVKDVLPSINEELKRVVK